jgi:PilZ domain
MVVSTESAHRRSNRIYVHVPVTIVVDSQGARVTYEATTVDLSTLGMRVRLNVAMVPGEHVDLILAGRSQKPFPSEVVWAAEAAPEQGREIGLVFQRPFQDVADSSTLVQWPGSRV